MSIGAIEHNLNGVARITDIITHPNFRNKGYASELISYLVTYTRQLPVDLVYLDTDNPIAMNIYKKCGFNILQDNFQFWVAHK